MEQNGFTYTYIYVNPFRSICIHTHTHIYIYIYKWNKCRRDSLGHIRNIWASLWHGQWILCRINKWMWPAQLSADIQRIISNLDKVIPLKCVCAKCRRTVHILWLWFTYHIIYHIISSVRLCAVPILFDVGYWSVWNSAIFFTVVLAKSVKMQCRCEIGSKFGISLIYNK
jgi:hypothetical protein